MKLVIHGGQEKITAEQMKTADMALEGEAVSQVMVWYEGEGLMGLQMIEDGVSRIGFFDKNGKIVGDWLC